MNEDINSVTMDEAGSAELTCSETDAIITQLSKLIAGLRKLPSHSQDLTIFESQIIQALGQQIQAVRILRKVRPESQVLTEYPKSSKFLQILNVPSEIIETFIEHWGECEILDALLEIVGDDLTALLESWSCHTDVIAALTRALSNLSLWLEAQANGIENHQRQYCWSIEGVGERRMPSNSSFGSAFQQLPLYSAERSRSSPSIQPVIGSSAIPLPPGQPKVISTFPTTPEPTPPPLEHRQSAPTSSSLIRPAAAAGPTGLPPSGPSSDTTVVTSGQPGSGGEGGAKTRKIKPKPKDLRLDNLDSMRVITPPVTPAAKPKRRAGTPPPGLMHTLHPPSKTGGGGGGGTGGTARGGSISGGTAGSSAGVVPFPTSSAFTKSISASERLYHTLQHPSRKTSTAGTGSFTIRGLATGYDSSFTSYHLQHSATATFAISSDSKKRLMSEGHAHPPSLDTFVPFQMKHKIHHRFQSKVIIRNCDYCTGFIFRGKLCKDCKAKYHTTCAITAPESCGIPAGYLELVTNVLKSPEAFHNGNLFATLSRRSGSTTTTNTVKTVPYYPHGPEPLPSAGHPFYMGGGGSGGGDSSSQSSRSTSNPSSPAVIQPFSSSMGGPVTSTAAHYLTSSVGGGQTQLHQPHSGGSATSGVHSSSSASASSLTSVGQPLPPPHHEGVTTILGPTGGSSTVAPGSSSSHHFLYSLPSPKIVITPDCHHSAASTSSKSPAFYYPDPLLSEEDLPFTARTATYIPPSPSPILPPPPPSPHHHQLPASHGHHIDLVDTTNSNDSSQTVTDEQEQKQQSNRRRAGATASAGSGSRQSRRRDSPSYGSPSRGGIGVTSGADNSDGLEYDDGGDYSEDEGVVPDMSDTTNGSGGLSQFDGSTDCSCSDHQELMPGLGLTDTSHDHVIMRRKSSYSAASREWDIPIEDLNLKASNRIGVGRFATVYKANWHGDVAVKILHNQNLKSPLPEAAYSEVKDEEDSVLGGADGGGGSFKTSSRLPSSSSQRSSTGDKYDRPSTDLGEWSENYRRRRSSTATQYDETRLAIFKLEVATLRKTRHENLNLFMGACSKLPYLAIVTSLCKGDSLYTHLHKRNDRFPFNKCIIIASQIAQAMAYLHSRKVIHKDLRSRNVFLEGNRIEVTDFGLLHVSELCEIKSTSTSSTSSSSTSTSHSTSTAAASSRHASPSQSTTGAYDRHSYQLCVPRGWFCYTSPEILKRLKVEIQHSLDLPYSYASDIYAFGALWFELLTGRYPYEVEQREAFGSPETLIWLICEGIRPSFDNLQGSKEAKDLMLNCTSYDVESRPTFKTVSFELERLPKKRLGRSPSHPVNMSRSVESVYY